MKTPAFVYFALFLSAQPCMAQVRDSINHTDKAGLRQGKWVKKDEGGVPVYSGTFLNNYPVGTFSYYYPNGSVKSLTTFYREKNQAFTMLFNPDGKKVSQGKVIGEKKDSTWTFYAGKDTIAAIENYRLGEKQGLFITYYKNSNVSAEKNFNKNIQEGPSREYFENGKIQREIFYVNGIRNGKAKFYSATGTLSMEGLYLNDLEDGKWSYYQENGTLDLQAIFKKGELVKSTRFNGLEELNYPDNIPKSRITYKNGLKNGIFVEYYDLGKIEMEIIPAKDGYPEEQKEAILGQKISRSGAFVNDKLDGIITWFKEDGTIDREETYKEGIYVKR
jgi:antitoxin component YwqK of YwqJK toxin-antitoxin module